MSYLQDFHRRHIEARNRILAAGKQYQRPKEPTTIVNMQFSKIDPKPLPSFDCSNITVSYKLPKLFAFNPDNSSPPIWLIIEITRNYYGIARSDFLADRRRKEFVRCRHVAMYIATQMTKQSLPQIGRHMGGRDHTTILHARYKISRLLKENARLAFEVDAIMTMIERENGNV